MCIKRERDTHTYSYTHNHTHSINTHTQLCVPCSCWFGLGQRCGCFLIALPSVAVNFDIIKAWPLTLARGNSLPLTLSLSLSRSLLMLTVSILICHQIACRLPSTFILTATSALPLPLAAILVANFAFIIYITSRSSLHWPCLAYKHVCVCVCVCEAFKYAQGHLALGCRSRDSYFYDY